MAEITHIDGYTKTHVTSRDSEPCYRLELRALPSSIPPEIRLRRALKALLRVYRFRVTDYGLASPTATATPTKPIVEASR